MTISEMLGQSGILTLLGMAVVFSFLIILIACMNLLRVIVKAFKLDKEEKAKSGAAHSGSTGSQTAALPAQDNGAIVAAIATFIEKK